MSSRRKNILMSAVSLYTGFVLYVLFREDTYIAKGFSFLPWVTFLQIWLAPKAPSFVKYHLQDFIWAFSLSCGLLAVVGSAKKQAFFCAVTAFFCGLLWEFLQYCKIVSGTGDLWDVLMYLAAGAVSVILNLEEREHEKV